MKRIIAMLLVLVITACSVQVVSAVSLNHKNLLLEYQYTPYTIKLKVNKAKKKVRWSTTSDKKHITVKKGKVKLKKKGKYTVYAKVGKKKLKCKIQYLSSTKYYKQMMKSYRQLKKNLNSIKYDSKELGKYEYVNDNGITIRTPVFDLINKKETIKALKNIRKNKIANSLEDDLTYKQEYKQLCKDAKIMQTYVEMLSYALKGTGDYYNLLCRIQVMDSKVGNDLMLDMPRWISGYDYYNDKWIGIKAWENRTDL